MEGDFPLPPSLPCAAISIHSLRVEGDTIENNPFLDGFANFNPLPPCGGRLLQLLIQCQQLDFNPLPPCGGRLYQEMGTHRGRGHFNPLPPCGGRPEKEQKLCTRFTISIHSLRVEGDEPRRCDTGGALISIHSLRVEGDAKRRQN